VASWSFCLSGYESLPEGTTRSPLTSRHGSTSKVLMMSPQLSRGLEPPRRHWRVYAGSRYRTSSKVLAAATSVGVSSRPEDISKGAMSRSSSVLRELLRIRYDFQLWSVQSPIYL
jgi:uncharacterized protein YbbK (DUF523 family)